LGLPDELPVAGVAVKEAVFPFTKLPGVDTVLGPEMRSTGEAMGLADSFGMAFAKAQIAAEGSLPLEGTIFVTVNDHDKPTVLRSPAASTRWGSASWRRRVRSGICGAAVCRRSVC